VALAAHIPGPFKVRSKEVNADFKGDLQVQLAGAETRILGSVEGLGGWVELLGRRYTLEHVRLGFGGEPEPDPTLDIRVTRQVTDAMVIIELHGRAKKPKLVMSSDPPVYDESQVLGIILSGDPATQRVSIVRSINR